MSCYLGKCIVKHQIEFLNIRYNISILLHIYYPLPDEVIKLQYDYPVNVPLFGIVNTINKLC